MKPQKTITYEIPSEVKWTRGGEETGSPMAKIVIEFPPIVENLSEFRSSLESVFAEILEACK